MEALHLFLMVSMALAGTTVMANPIMPGSPPIRFVEVPPPLLLDPQDRLPDVPLPPAVPQVVEAPAPVPIGLQGLIMLSALGAESLLVALLAWPGSWVSSAFRWMLVTTGTCIGLILVPCGIWDIHIHTVTDAVGGRVLLLESVIVVLESFVLWRLLPENRNRANRRQEWAAGAAFVDSLGISLAGNGVSFLTSVICVGVLS